MSQVARDLPLNRCARPGWRTVCDLRDDVARNTSCREVDGMPWLRRTRRAYRRLEHDDSRWSTCSVAVRRLLTMTPRILWLFTRSMFIQGGGGSDVFPRLPRAVNIISFVLCLNSCLLSCCSCRLLSTEISWCCLTISSAKLFLCWRCTVSKMWRQRHIWSYSVVRQRHFSKKKFTWTLSKYRTVTEITWQTTFFNIQDCN